MKSTIYTKLTISALLVAAALMQGCATSDKIQSTQVGDDRLTCAQIREEFTKLDKATADIESKKGVTGTNVASALLWLPGLAFTYYDAGEATKLIYERRSNLTGIANKKQCAAQVEKEPVPAPEPVAAKEPTPEKVAVAVKEVTPAKKKVTVKKQVPAKQ